MLIFPMRLTSSKNTLTLPNNERVRGDMAPSPVEATAAELLAGLPQRLDHVFRSWSKSAPKQPALIGEGKVWSYGALAGIVDDAAAALRDHGVRPGDRVMVVSENRDRKSVV